MALSVAQDPANAGDAVELGALIESTIRRNGKLRLVDLADAVDPSGAQARADKAKAAAEALAQARRAYDSLDVDAAGDFAQRAVFLGIESPLSQRREALTAALLLAGAARYYAGDEAGARDEFLRLFGIDPSARLNKADWSPEVLQVAEDERSRGLAQKRGEAAVRSEPVPARIYVDGLYGGVAPIVLRGLGPGPHSVTAVAPGYQQKNASLHAGSEQTLVLEPAPSGRALLALEEQLAASFGAREGDEALRQAGRDAGVEQVVGARFEHRGALRIAHLVRVSVADGKRLAEVSGEIALTSPAGMSAADVLIGSVLP